jgi:phosphopantetheinyl transferase
MFRHVLVQASEHPSLAAGQAWPGLLSPREEALLAGLAFLPRRRKWLLGRAAAKRLLALWPGLAEAPPTSLSVLNRPSGEPFVLVAGQGEWPHAISLSHRSAAGLAAAPETPGQRIGADLETVEPRDPALVRQFFTDGETALVAGGGQNGDEIVARIWSAKEAVLKLLGLGLRLDTRAIAVSLDGEPWAGCPTDFDPIDVSLRPDVLPTPWPGSMRVAWRKQAGFVVTIAVADGCVGSKP